MRWIVFRWQNLTIIGVQVCFLSITLCETLRNDWVTSHNNVPDGKSEAFLVLNPDVPQNSVALVG